MLPLFKPPHHNCVNSRNSIYSIWLFERVIRVGRATVISLLLQHLPEIQGRVLITFQPALVTRLLGLVGKYVYASVFAVFTGLSSRSVNMLWNNTMLRCTWNHFQTYHLLKPGRSEPGDV